MLAQSPLLSGSLIDGLHGLLLTPGASVFVYSPLLLLLPLTLPEFYRRHRAECVTALAIVASFLGLCGTFLFWHGLWSSPGPRYLFVATPLLMLPLGPWLDGARRTWQWLAVGGLALACVCRKKCCETAPAEAAPAPEPVAAAPVEEPPVEAAAAPEPARLSDG